MKNRKSNKNALVHGVYASDVLLPWESRAGFEKLLDELRAELNINGASEEEIAFDIAVKFWNKRRVKRMEQASMTRAQFSAAVKDSGERGFSGIERAIEVAHQQRANKAKAHQGTMDSLMKKLSALDKKLAGRTKASPKLQNDLCDLNTEVARLAILMEDLRSVRGGDVLDAAYAAKAWAPALEIDARLDAAIHKLYGRLANIKEFKKMYAAPCQLIPPEVNAGKPAKQSRDSGYERTRATLMKPLPSRTVTTDENENDDEEWGN